MTDYESVFSQYSEKFLAKLDKSIRKKIINKIEWLIKNINEIPHISLGYDLSDFYKLRVGRIRIIYSIEHNKRKVIVAYIDYRDKIYNQLK